MNLWRLEYVPNYGWYYFVKSSWMGEEIQLGTFFSVKPTRKQMKAVRKGR